jgi:hypothetical protein
MLQTNFCHNMDPLELIAVHNAIRIPSQHTAFDHMVRSLHPVDPNGHIRRCFDAMKGNDTSLLHTYDILYSCISK